MKSFSEVALAHRRVVMQPAAVQARQRRTVELAERRALYAAIDDAGGSNHIGRRPQIDPRVCVLKGTACCTHDAIWVKEHQHGAFYWAILPLAQPPGQMLLHRAVVDDFGTLVPVGQVLP